MEDPDKTLPPVPPRSDFFGLALAAWLLIVGVIVTTVVLIVTR